MKRRTIESPIGYLTLTEEDGFLTRLDFGGERAGGDRSARGTRSC